MMNDIVRYLSLGLTLSSVAKVTFFGATWQSIAALGILALVTLVIYGIRESDDMRHLGMKIDGLHARLDKLDKDVESNKNEMSALRMNKGITTRRIG